MRSRILTPVALLTMLCALGGCTQQELDSSIATAAVISCVMADGSQVEYSVATAVVANQANPSGANSQKVLNVSSSVASGSQALCISLSNLNAKLQTTK